MSFEHKDMSGTLFKNDKGDNPKRPDYRGELLVHGELLEIAAWLKDGAKGKFMSLAVKPKQERAQAAAVATPQRAAPQRAPAAGVDDDDMSDGIPF